MPKFNKTKLMAVCHKEFGAKRGSLQIIAPLVAQRLGVVVPVSKRDRWQMIQHFVASLSLPSLTPKPYRPFTSKINPTSDAFLSGYQWRALRMKAITRDGRRCACCRRTPEQHGLSIHVDHIKPRRDYPDLALDLDNLQVLCEECNHGKGNWDATNWRELNAYAENKPIWEP